MAVSGLTVHLSLRRWAVLILYPVWFVQVALGADPWVPRWIVRVRHGHHG